MPIATTEDVRRETRRFPQMVPGGYWRDLSLAGTAELLRGGVHEERRARGEATSLFILVRKFATGDQEERGRIFDVVLASTGRIDNWDLVDSPAPYIARPWSGTVERLTSCRRHRRPRRRPRTHRRSRRRPRRTAAYWTGSRPWWW